MRKLKPNRSILIRSTLFSLIFLMSIYLFAPERNRIAIMSGKGELSFGCKFEICIGDRLPEAHSAIVHNGFKFAYDREIDDLKGERVYIENAWRRGTITLTLQNNTVKKIEWHYTLGAI